MNRTAILYRSLLLGSLTLAPLACQSEPQGEPLGQEGAHEHGVADLSLVVAGREVSVAFQAPAGDLFGSEGGEPTPEERASARVALERIEGSLVAMLGFPEELGCRVVEVSWAGAAEAMLAPEADAASPGASGGSAEGGGEEGHVHGEEVAGGSDEGQDPEAEHEHDEGGGHSDVIGDFGIACAGSLDGVTLELAVSEHLEAIQKVDLQAVSGDRQFGRRVAASGTRLPL